MANKMTKKEVVMAMLATEEIAKNETFKAYLERELELLSKKRNRSDKPTKTQIENVGIKEEILNALAGVSSEGIEIKEIIGRGDFAEGISTQKISALLKQLKEEGKVGRVEGKKALYFPIVEED